MIKRGKMGANSSIEWTDHTFNPWWGCVKVSPACDSCYAETMAKRVGFQVWGKDTARRMVKDSYWDMPLSWNRWAEKHNERLRVFCGSMCDVMEDAPDLQQVRERKLYPLIEATPFLDWLLLTKRPQNFRRFFPDKWIKDPLPNIVGMTTVESSQYLWRAEVLLRTPFARRGLSMEPLLGHVDIGPFIGIKTRKLSSEWHGPTLTRGIDWVIVGGESGHGARPMHPDWVRAIRDECAKCGVPFFFKQWGKWLPADQIGADGDKPTPATTGSEWGVLDSDGRFRHATRWITGPGVYSDDGEIYVYRVGKGNAGRLLDGREHLDYPLGA
jgi:protein gp37